MPALAMAAGGCLVSIMMIWVGNYVCMMCMKYYVGGYMNVLRVYRLMTRTKGCCVLGMGWYCRNRDVELDKDEREMGMVAQHTHTQNSTDFR